MELGSYVKYEPTKTSYTASKENTGYTEDSTINPSELTSWRVLKVNDDGTVEIVSTNVSTDNMSFGGETGYVNLVSELQKAAKAYINTKYASNARTLGYNGQTLVIEDKTALEQTTNPWSWMDDENQYETTGGGDNYYLTDVNLMDGAGISLKTTELNGTSAVYWLTSRYFESHSWNWLFCGYFVNSDSDDRLIDNTSLHYYMEGEFDNSDFYSYQGDFSIRPVVTLKANQEMAGSGTEDDPYTFSEVKKPTESEGTTSLESTEKVSNPKTGDNIMTYVLTSILSISIIFVLLIYKRKDSIK